MSSMNNLLFRVAAFGMLFVAVPAFAQETDEVQELQRVNDAQQRQLEAQQRQIETLMQMVEQLQSEVEPLVSSADKEGATPDEVDAPTEPLSASAVAGVPPQPASKIGLSQIDRFDPDTPTASDVTYISPTAMIQVPGSDTSVGVHGMLQFQIAHDTSGPDSNQWNTASIPVDGAPSETKFNVNPSRFVISSVTEYPGNSQLNTLLSVDLKGQETVPELRLRLAWVEYVNELEPGDRGDRWTSFPDVGRPAGGARDTRFRDFGWSVGTAPGAAAAHEVSQRDLSNGSINRNAAERSLHQCGKAHAAT